MTIVDVDPLWRRRTMIPTPGLKRRKALKHWLGSRLRIP